VDDLSRLQKNSFIIFFIYELRFSGVFCEKLVLLGQCCVRFFYLFSTNSYFTLDETIFLQGIFIILPELPMKEKQYFFLSNFIIYK
jgi:hypothetical protein